MTIRVNIGEAKTRLSELVAASLRGEEIVLQKAGVPQARIIAIPEALRRTNAEIAARRVAAFGKYKKEFEGFDVSLEALKADRPDPDEKWRRKLDPDY